MIRIISSEEFPYMSLYLQENWLCYNVIKSYPELPHGVDVLGFQKSIIIAVHQTLAMDDCCVVHQYRNISHLRLKSARIGRENPVKNVKHLLSAFLK